ncbi:MAG: hypothetical protein NC928_03050, partial [Candidatus Omnitrophica bacterium]|nr:hypothetical protein [Candidatus Omnitrophota bacterium]
MKTEVKKIDSTKREISIQIGGEVVKNKFDSVYKKIAKDAKVPGFRPGNAPRDILEKHYSSYAHQQVLEELIPLVYNQAIEKEGLDVVELPEIFDVKLDQQNLSFKARVEVTPEIPVRNYKGIKIEYKKINVSVEEIKSAVEAIKESRKAEAVDDSLAKGLGYPNLTELKNALERQIYLQKENLQRTKIENELLERITKDLDFKLPEALLKRQLEELLRQAKLDLALKGLSSEKIEQEEKSLSEQLQPQAKKQVKIYLVLAAIAKNENIPLDDQMPRRVMEFLLRQADWQ